MRGYGSQHGGNAELRLKKRIGRQGRRPLTAYSVSPRIQGRDVGLRKDASGHNRTKAAYSGNRHHFRHADNRLRNPGANCRTCTARVICPFPFTSFPIGSRGERDGRDGTVRQTRTALHTDFITRNIEKQDRKHYGA